MKRIICLGNRYVPDDAAGPLVYDRLVSSSLPPDLEVVDGGLGGLNLLHFLEDVERVVFVDRVSGFGRPQETILLEGTEVAALAEGSYDHAAGLPYLLRVMPKVCGNPAGQVLVVGVEGRLEGQAADKIASLALRLARYGRSGLESGEPRGGGGS
ncbi:MAG: hydrogenase maturation protease [Thermodesulfobacteriota bacterium]